jgi:hypothetical protein
MERWQSAQGNPPLKISLGVINWILKSILKIKNYFLRGEGV